MNLKLINSGSPNTKPWLNPIANNLKVNSIETNELKSSIINTDDIAANEIKCDNINTNNINTNTINNIIPFTHSVFYGNCQGPMRYRQNEIVRDSINQIVNVSQPGSDFNLGDCIVFYNGPSDNIYNYIINCNFLTNMIGTYIISLYINGNEYTLNQNTVFAGSTHALTTISISDTSIFYPGYFFQFSIKKGDDIPDEPDMEIYNTSYTFIRVA